jgi:hypothetical protein
MLRGTLHEQKIIDSFFYGRNETKSAGANCFERSQTGPSINAYVALAGYFTGNGCNFAGRG